MKKKEMVYLKVVRSEIYTFEKDSINGWSTEQVIKDWFEVYPLHSYHRTRDSHKVGSSDRFVSAKELTENDIVANIIQ